MGKVELTKNFANKNKGDILSLDGMLASYLVRVSKVAKYYKEKKKK